MKKKEAVVASVDISGNVLKVHRKQDYPLLWVRSATGQRYWSAELALTHEIEDHLFSNDPRRTRHEVSEEVTGFLRKIKYTS